MTPNAPSVLVVHSDFALRLAWHDAFERLGWQPRLAMGRDEALRALRADCISVLCVGGEPEQEAAATMMKGLAAAHPEVARVLLLQRGAPPPPIAELNDAAAHGFLEEPPSAKGVTATLTQAVSAAWPPWLRQQLWRARATERAHPGLARVHRSDEGDYVLDELAAARGIDRLWQTRIERRLLRPSSGSRSNGDDPTG